MLAKALGRTNLDSKVDPRRRGTVLFAIAIVGLVIALYSSLALIGREARTVDVVTIFFSAFGSGAAFVDALMTRARARGR